METMRKSWTDERLDDLAQRMDRGFDRVDCDIRDLKAETNARFDRMEGRFDRLEARFDSMQRLLLAAYISAVLGFVFTQL
jgi:hypothetical protein